jgi:hypothetical protein
MTTALDYGYFNDHLIPAIVEAGPIGEWKADFWSALHWYHPTAPMVSATPGWVEDPTAVAVELDSNGDLGMSEEECFQDDIIIPFTGVVETDVTLYREAIGAFLATQVK